MDAQASFQQLMTASLGQILDQSGFAADPRVTSRFRALDTAPSSWISRMSLSFEAIIFSEGLSHYRDLLEPGAALVLQLQASTEGEDVRARIQTCEPLDQAASRHQKGMRIYLRDERPISSVQQRLQVRGEGEVSLILILDGGEREVEVKLGGKYQATPQIAGALRAVPGVVQVEVS